MDKPYIIIDDLLPSEIADNIEHMMFNDLNWRYISDITHDGEHRNTPAMAHVFANVEWQGYKCSFMPRVMPIVEYGTKAVNFDWKTILKVRSFLQVPLHENFSKVHLDALHTDQPFPHLVLLYYVIDADGDTIIVNHKRNGQRLENLKAESYEQLVRVTPKKNRLVIFDGEYYHTAEQPRNGLRNIINFNLLGEFK